MTRLNGDLSTENNADCCIDHGRHPIIPAQGALSGNGSMQVDLSRRESIATPTQQTTIYEECEEERVILIESIEEEQYTQQTPPLMLLEGAEWNDSSHGTKHNY